MHAFTKSIVTRHGGDEAFLVKDLSEFACKTLCPEVVKHYQTWVEEGRFPIAEFAQPLTPLVLQLLGVEGDM
jgi:hypothetical protein